MKIEVLPALGGLDHLSCTTLLERSTPPSAVLTCQLETARAAALAPDHPPSIRVSP